MCVVSMIANNFRDRWPDMYPGLIHGTYPPPQPAPPIHPQVFPVGVSQKEFDDLKKEVEIMKDLLKKAKVYDVANNEPNCELEEKMDFLRAIAKIVGVDLEDVLAK